MFWLLLACAGKSEGVEPEVAVEEPVPAVEVVEVVEVTPTEQAPSVRVLLKARHADDLPDRAALEAHEDALDQLIALSREDDELIVRERALLLLALYPESDTARALLIEVAAGTDHAKLRAAAFRGLVPWAGEDEVRALASTAAEDPDARVQAAATALLE